MRRRAFLVAAFGSACSASEAPAPSPGTSAEGDAAIVSFRVVEVEFPATLEDAQVFEVDERGHARYLFADAPKTWRLARFDLTESELIGLASLITEIDFFSMDEPGESDAPEVGTRRIYSVRAGRRSRQVTCNFDFPPRVMLLRDRLQKLRDTHLTAKNRPRALSEGDAITLRRAMRR